MTKFRIALATAAAALAITAVPAIAKDAVYTPTYYTPDSTASTGYEEDIIVTPYGVRESRDGTLTLSRTISTKGLDLRSPSGVDELNRRINWTARDICEELDDAAPRTSLSSDRDCVRDAVRGARDQAEAIIDQARS